jgi:hypothetical protein
MNIIDLANNIHANVTIFAAQTISGGVSGGAEAARGEGQPSDLFGNAGVLTEITNVILFVVGILSVIMLIYGGLRYVISGGDSKKVTDAKNTIMYAIIGLIIAILSFAIVNFVINAFTGSGGTV